MPAKNIWIFQEDINLLRGRWFSKRVVHVYVFITDPDSFVTCLKTMDNKSNES